MTRCGGISSGRLQRKSLPFDGGKIQRRSKVSFDKVGYSFEESSYLPSRTAYLKRQNYCSLSGSIRVSLILSPRAENNFLLCELAEPKTGFITFPRSKTRQRVLQLHHKCMHTGQSTDCCLLIWSGVVNCLAEPNLLFPSANQNSAAAFAH